MDWFFSRKSSTIQLVLKPDDSGKKWAGFLSGVPLTCIVTPGETLAMALERFNTYRGPDQQITAVWSETGASIPLSTVLRQDTVVIVRG